MLSSRIPLAMSGGGLLSLAMFWALWNMINSPIDVGDRVVATRIDFSRLLVDTAVNTKRPEKIERKPPPAVPDTPLVVTSHGATDHSLPHATPTFETVVGPIDRMIGGSDRDVVPIVRIKPDYPPRALANGTEGWVKVQFSVAATGMVRDAVVVDADPRNVFDKETLQAVMRWRYNPKIENGVAVERIGLQTVLVFELEK